MLSLSLIGLVGVVVAFLIHYAYNAKQEDRKLAHIPTHSFEDGDDRPKRYLTDLKGLLESGYRKYSVHSQPFKVRIPIGGYSVKYRVVLPKDHLEEIKHLSNNIFSWQLASRIIFAQDYTGAPDRGPWSGKALRVGIHQNLSDITAATDKALSDMFVRELPQDADSSLSISMMEFFVRIVGTVTNAKLVESRLANNPDWVRESCDFAVSRYAAADEVRAWPPLLSKFVAPFLPSVARLRESRAYNKEMMKPLYDDLREQSLQSKGDKESRRKGVLGYEWLWSGAPADVTLDDFSDTMMRTLIASIHTTAKTITVAFIDLLTQPEYYHELREEAMEAVDPDGRNVDLEKLFKLDCFLKESQRLTPVFLLTMNRILTQPYSFKCSSTTLPEHCMTSGPSAAIATDPSIFDHPNTFDGHRYRRMRTEHKDAESSMVMGMSTIDSLGFGLGNQACPGRFFAVNNMKLIMAKMLTQYELTLEQDGQRYTGPRPEMGYNDFSVVVPKNYSLRLRKLSIVDRK